MSRNVSGLSLSSHIQAHPESIFSKAERSRPEDLRLGPRARRVAMVLAGIGCAALGAAAGIQPALTTYDRLRANLHETNLTSGLVYFCAGVLLSSLVAAFVYRAVRSRADQGSRRRSEKTDPCGSLALSGTSRVWQGQEEQGKRLSRELHDSVGSLLTGIGLQLNSMRRAPASPELRSQLDEITQLNAEALRLVRDLAAGLRPSLTKNMSLGSALEWRARQFTRQTGIPAVVDSEVSLDEVSEEHGVCIYRCVEEALTNCAKYSEARNVRIVARASKESLTVTVEDDGIGFDARRMDGRGLGLLGMRERLAAIAGALSITSRMGKGTSVILEIPVAGSVLV